MKRTLFRWNAGISIEGSQMTVKKDEKVVYQGEYVYAGGYHLAHGKGKYCSDEEEREGCFVYGRQEGPGSLFNKKNDTFVKGNFIANVAHGKCKFREGNRPPKMIESKHGVPSEWDWILTDPATEISQNIISSIFNDREVQVPKSDLATSFAMHGLKFDGNFDVHIRSIPCYVPETVVVKSKNGKLYKFKSHMSFTCLIETPPDNNDDDDDDNDQNGNPPGGEEEGSNSKRKQPEKGDPNPGKKKKRRAKKSSAKNKKKRTRSKSNNENKSPPKKKKPKSNKEKEEIRSEDKANEFPDDPWDIFSAPVVIGEIGLVTLLNDIDRKGRLPVPDFNKVPKPYEIHKMFQSSTNRIDIANTWNTLKGPGKGLMARRMENCLPEGWYTKLFEKSKGPKINHREYQTALTFNRYDGRFPYLVRSKIDREKFLYLKIPYGNPTKEITVASALDKFEKDYPRDPWLKKLKSK